MAYSYNGLWHLLVDKGMKKTDLKEIALTTDIIVGFPGETTEEFEDTLA